MYNYLGFLFMLVVVFCFFSSSEAFCISKVCPTSFVSSGIYTQIKSRQNVLMAGGRERSRGPPRRKAPKDDVIQVTGKVVESLPNAMFRVEIEPSKQIVLATISGKIRKNYVRIIVGDSVTCELSAYDLTRGRITYRNK
mmetsp:Transcript_19754/g.19867  ORF Transcript_19754/g.19867 Transcript_19754/m.19867 type:complete len:139 (+) Transcript_19754:91-507(+)